MNLSDFDYNLPEKLIAQTPLEKRDTSRLLVLDKNEKTREDKIFSDIVDELGENDVLVVNKTRVMNARLSGELESGREVEVFLHNELEAGIWDCIVFPGKKLKPGKKIKFPEFPELEGEVIKVTDLGRKIKFNISGEVFLDIIEKIGEIPLPPYIKEKLENNERYQTVYNEKLGSVAAPTAGLHFTPELLEKLEKKGVKIEKVLLHVGAGTFKPVQTDNILEHKMHSEYIELERETSEKLNKYKKEGKRIIAVGTTSIRVLESFSDENGELKFGQRNTDIFIYPGYKWKFVDAMVTNFHLPKSTLLMLVSSFAGREFMLESYNHAVENNYRFFSFGDAMLIK
ncbi:MAG: tRNA preQ1(34) S-adenosylmethionine ribosyltransferase-isomerase QueA [Candidatus Gracilibacteria bacterium]|nr:tRNA preQ1(34) S-adenosylmethionine ribosyltransferase-isomerase QueA [Candidatus Gracilibacteria bacterium]